MVHEDLPIEWPSVSFSKYLFFSGMILSHHDQGHLVFQKNLVVQSNIDIEAGDKCEQCCDWDGQDGQVGHLCCSHFVMCSPGALLTCLMLTCQCQGVSVWPACQTEHLHFRKLRSAPLCLFQFNSEPGHFLSPAQLVFLLTSDGMFIKSWQVHGSSRKVTYIPGPGNNIQDNIFTWHVICSENNNGKM